MAQGDGFQGKLGILPAEMIRPAINDVLRHASIAPPIVSPPWEDVGARHTCWLIHLVGKPLVPPEVGPLPTPAARAMHSPIAIRCGKLGRPDFSAAAGYVLSRARYDCALRRASLYVHIHQERRGANRVGIVQGCAVSYASRSDAAKIPQSRFFEPLPAPGPAWLLSFSPTASLMKYTSGVLLKITSERKHV